MNQRKPVLNVNCILKDTTEKKYSIDIDLSYDPLLGKPYVKEWIANLLNKKFNALNDVDIFNISQNNIEYCREDLPQWYYQLNNTDD
tara:strand:+ start:66 stop:326 length:261 start_codon:yes stop_codon:yes gene_type:complete